MNMSETKRNMYGLLFELKRFIAKTAPSGKTPDYFSYTTNAYKLHCYETATGRKFIILTDTAVGDMKDELKKIYNQIFVEYVIKNPLFHPGTSASRGADSASESLKDCELFNIELLKYLQSLPYWKTPVVVSA
jgi:hypothetical protein